MQDKLTEISICVVQWRVGKRCSQSTHNRVGGRIITAELPKGLVVFDFSSKTACFIFGFLWPGRTWRIWSSRAEGNVSLSLACALHLSVCDRCFTLLPSDNEVCNAQWYSFPALHPVTGFSPFQTVSMPSIARSENQLCKCSAVRNSQISTELGSQEWPCMLKGHLHVPTSSREEMVSVH